MLHRYITTLSSGLAWAQSTQSEEGRECQHERWQRATDPPRWTQLWSDKIYAKLLWAFLLKGCFSKEKAIPESSYGPTPEIFCFDVSIFNETRVVLDTHGLCDCGCKVLRPPDSRARGYSALFELPARANSCGWLRAIVPVPVEDKHCVGWLTYISLQKRNVPCCSSCQVL